MEPTCQKRYFIFKHFVVAVDIFLDCTINYNVCVCVCTYGMHYEKGVADSI